MTAQLFGGLCAAAILVAVVGVPALRRWLHQRGRDREWEAQNAAWRVQFEADNPVGVPFSEGEIAEFKAWLASRALPYVVLEPDPEANLRERGTYIGGPAWLDPDTPWPLDPSGAPMEFVAQLDFAGLPALPDFPERGVLQLFVQQNDFHGADFDDPRQSVATALWHPEPPPGRIAVAQPSVSERVSPFFDTARREGVVLAHDPPATMEPPPLDWLIDERLEGQLRRRGIEDIDDLLYAEDRYPPLRHQVGGYPVFVQQDFCKRGFADDYDRVLLRLTSDDHILWGDSGEANFLVTAKDLRECNFDRIAYTWDCS